jgi:hypothetical protein
MSSLNARREIVPLLQSMTPDDRSPQYGNSDPHRHVPMHAHVGFAAHSAGIGAQPRAMPNPAELSFTHVVPAGQPPRTAVRSGHPPVHDGGEPGATHAGPPASAYLHTHVETPELFAVATQSASVGTGNEEHAPWFGHWTPGVVHVVPHTLQTSDGQLPLSAGGGGGGGRTVHATAGHVVPVTHCSVHVWEPAGPEAVSQHT